MLITRPMRSWRAKDTAANTSEIVPTSASTMTTQENRAAKGPKRPTCFPAPSKPRSLRTAAPTVAAARTPARRAEPSARSPLRRRPGSRFRERQSAMRDQRVDEIGAVRGRAAQSPVHQTQILSEATVCDRDGRPRATPRGNKSAIRTRTRRLPSRPARSLAKVQCGRIAHRDPPTNTAAPSPSSRRRHESSTDVCIVPARIHAGRWRARNSRASVPGGGCPICEIWSAARRCVGPARRAS